MELLLPRACEILRADKYLGPITARIRPDSVGNPSRKSLREEVFGTSKVKDYISPRFEIGTLCPMPAGRRSRQLMGLASPQHRQQRGGTQHAARTTAHAADSAVLLTKAQSSRPRALLSCQRAHLDLTQPRCCGCV
eukprot:1086883-Pleurochrysis_carterae.AAC.3